jgi:hypothetical protein
MLVIRRIKAEDAKSVADLIRKSPIRRSEVSNSTSKLRWVVNSSSSQPQEAIDFGNKYLEKQISQSGNKQEFLVVEDNGKVVGAVRKYGVGNVANLYLDKKYSRRGMQKSLINNVEQSYLRQVGNRFVTKPPLRPTSVFSIIKNPINVKPIRPSSFPLVSKFSPKTFRQK